LTLPAVAYVASQQQSADVASHHYEILGSRYGYSPSQVYPTVSQYVLPDDPHSEGRLVVPVRRVRQRSAYYGLNKRLQRAKKVAIAGLLVFGLIHASILVYTSGIKVFGLLKQQQAVVQLHHQLIQKNNLLKQNIKRYSQSQGVEELARNQLNWITDNELLVRIKPTAVALP
jgi:cell division protein FtsB